MKNAVIFILHVFATIVLVYYTYQASHFRASISYFIMFIIALVFFLGIFGAAFQLEYLDKKREDEEKEMKEEIEIVKKEDSIRINEQIERVKQIKKEMKLKKQSLNSKEKKKRKK